MRQIKILCVRCERGAGFEFFLEPHPITSICVAYLLLFLDQQFRDKGFVFARKRLQERSLSEKLSGNSILPC
jgi:hypothetical protein